VSEKDGGDSDSNEESGAGGKEESELTLVGIRSGSSAVTAGGECMKGSASGACAGKGRQVWTVQGLAASAAYDKDAKP
jgi:hypothetical protein